MSIKGPREDLTLAIVFANYGQVAIVQCEPVQLMVAHPLPQPYGEFVQIADLLCMVSCFNTLLCTR